MEIKSKANYDPATSDERIREILNSSEKFEEVNEIPSRDKLTFSNGYYVNCTALFIDIRGSSQLPETHTRPVLGKIYRAYLSECIALMNRNENCKEAFINGDCVSGIFNTPLKKDVNSVFSTAAQLNSLIKMLNWRLEQKRYTPISCGVGLDYGRALMMKAGFKGSGINDVIWMGDVINEASNLCHQGNKGYRKAIQASCVIYNNLTSDNKNLFQSVLNDDLHVIQYEGNIINTAMNEWLNTEIQKSQNLKSILQAFG